MAVKNVRYKTIPMALPTITFGMSHVEGADWPDSLCHASSVPFKGPLGEHLTCCVQRLFKKYLTACR